MSIDLKKMQEDAKRKMNNAYGDIHVSIKPGMKVKLSVDANGNGLFLAITSLIGEIVRKTGVKKEMVLQSIDTFMDFSECYECESEEQMNVMQEIIKTGMRPEDLQK